jgi:hypothetical protein
MGHAENSEPAYAILIYLLESELPSHQFIVQIDGMIIFHVNVTVPHSSLNPTNQGRYRL